MSTIGSLNVDSGMSTLLQRLSQSQTKGSARTGGPSEAERAEFEKKFEAAATAAGLDVDKLKSIQSDIQTAISTTIQNYSNPADKTGLQDAVQKAVNEVLEKNGFDPETVKQQLQTARESMKPKDGQMMPPPPPPTDESGAATGTSGSTQTAKTSAQSLMGLLRILEGSQDSQTNQTGQTNQTNQIDLSQLLTTLGLDIQA
jgi:hypothetical protein